MNTGSHRFFAFLWVLWIVGCGATTTSSNPQDGASDQAADAAPPVGEPSLFFTINIHIEPSKSYCSSKTGYDAAKDILERLKRAAEGIGAKLSVFTEYTFLYGAREFEAPGNNVFTRLLASGHTVGFHSHYGSFFKLGSSVDNLCVNGEEIREQDYVAHFEQIMAQVLGTQTVFDQVQAVYGDARETLGDLIERGVKGIYREVCSFPDAGDAAEYEYAVTYESTPAVPGKPVVTIPTTIAGCYLSSIYSNPAAQSGIDCYRPESSSSKVCGAWYQGDFDLVAAAVEKAAQTARQGINAIGITTHLHNFSDETTAENCGREYTQANSAELAMFETWLRTRIKPLKDSGLLGFATANELITLVLP